LCICKLEEVQGDATNDLTTRSVSRGLTING